MQAESAAKNEDIIHLIVSYSSRYSANKDRSIRLFLHAKLPCLPFLLNLLPVACCTMSKLWQLHPTWIISSDSYTRHICVLNLEAHTYTHTPTLAHMCRHGSVSDCHRFVQSLYLLRLSVSLSAVGRGKLQNKGA